MAKEYIDKEAFLSDNIFLVGGFVEDEYVEGYMNALDDIEEVIRKLPAANVRENVKGWWIEDSDGDGRHCSVCGKDYCYLISDCETYTFCPHCGACMEGTEDE